jgi:hypothetical protein
MRCLQGALTARCRGRRQAALRLLAPLSFFVMQIDGPSFITLNSWAVLTQFRSLAMSSPLNATGRQTRQEMEN